MKKKYEITRTDGSSSRVKVAADDRIGKKWTLFNIVAVIVLGIYAASLIFALLWALMSSFKSRFDFRENPLGFPTKFYFENYKHASVNLGVKVETSSGYRTVYMFELLGNTLLYALGSTFFSVISPCITAYAVAKYDFKGKNLIYAIVIVTMLLPIVGNLPSMMVLMRAIGFYNNIVGIWISKGSFLGMNFLIFYAVFKSLSWEYAEAAFIDGATHGRVFFQIMLPLVKTTIFALALLGFIGYWNEYETQLIYIPSMPTLAYGLFVFQFSTDTYASAVTVRLAGCMIAAIPMFVIYMACKNLLLGNIAVGGIKG